MKQLTHYRSREARQVRHRVGMASLTAGLADTLIDNHGPGNLWRSWVAHTGSRGRAAAALGTGLGAVALMNYGVGRGGAALVQKIRRKRSEGGWRRG